jgi:hypothetical protein
MGGTGRNAPVAALVLVAVVLLAAGCVPRLGGTKTPVAPRTSEVTTSAPAPETNIASVTPQPESPTANGSGAPATSAMHKPGFESPERKAILDALRPAVENSLKQKVVFKVDRLRVMDGFAFLQAQPLQPNEKPIDYSKTEYAEAYANGAFDDRVDALLRWNGERWRTVKWVLGATDVAWENWPDETGAPADLFEP